MENKEEFVKLRKIPIRVLLDALSTLYNAGANYIDLIGIANEEQDRIGLSVQEEYMALEEEIEEEEQTELEENSPPAIIRILTEEDLNNLI